MHFYWILFSPLDYTSETEDREAFGPNKTFVWTDLSETVSGREGGRVLSSFGRGGYIQMLPGLSAEHAFQDAQMTISYLKVLSFKIKDPRALLFWGRGMDHKFFLYKLIIFHPPPLPLIICQRILCG